jgi:hypothetical protein
MTADGFDRSCSLPFCRQLSAERTLPSSPAGRIWARSLADPRSPSPLRSSVPAWALLIALLLGLLVGILELALPGKLVALPLSDSIASSGDPPRESLTLDDSAPDDYPSTRETLTVGDRCLSPPTVMGKLAVMHTWAWPIFYLNRPQLLKRIYPLR